VNGCGFWYSIYGRKFEGASDIDQKAPFVWNSAIPVIRLQRMDEKGKEGKRKTLLSPFLVH